MQPIWCNVIEQVRQNVHVDICLKWIHPRHCSIYAHQVHEKDKHNLISRDELLLFHRHIQDVLVLMCKTPGPDSIQRCLTSLGNPIVQIRLSSGRLISIVGFLTLARQRFDTESGPCILAIWLAGSTYETNLSSFQLSLAHRCKSDAHKIIVLFSPMCTCVPQARNGNKYFGRWWPNCVNYWPLCIFAMGYEYIYVASTSNNNLGCLQNTHTTSTISEYQNVILNQTYLWLWAVTFVGKLWNVGTLHFLKIETTRIM